MTATLPDPYFDLDAQTLSDRGLYELPWHGELLAWMLAEGMAPNDTRRVEVFVVDCPFARVTRYALTENGKRIANDAGDELVTVEETMLVSSLPPLPPA
ncbi:hypothetical protein [Streptosporangium sp. G12]